MANQEPSRKRIWQESMNPLWLETLAAYHYEVTLIFPMVFDRSEGVMVPPSDAPDEISGHWRFAADGSEVDTSAWSMVDHHLIAPKDAIYLDSSDESWDVAAYLQAFYTYVSGGNGSCENVVGWMSHIGLSQHSMYVAQIFAALQQFSARRSKIHDKPTERTPFLWTPTGYDREDPKYKALLKSIVAGWISHPPGTPALD